MRQGEIRIHLQGDPSNDIKRVDDVAQRFAHLPSVGVPHDGVQINLCTITSLRVVAVVWVSIRITGVIPPPPTSTSLGDSSHLFKGQLAGQFEAHHDHASHPEEQDIVTRL